MRKTSPIPPIRASTMQNKLNFINEKMFLVNLKSGTKLTRIATVTMATQIIVVEDTICNLANFLKEPSLNFFLIIATNQCNLSLTIVNILKLKKNVELTFNKIRKSLK